MDIDNNTFQHQAAVITPVKMDNIKQPVDSLFKSVADATKKTEVPSVSAGTSAVGETKAAKGPDDLKQAVNKLNDHVQNIQRDLQFNIDIESGVIVVKVIDAKSEKVIRQMPTEETLKLAHVLVEQNDHAAFNIFSSRA